MTKIKSKMIEEVNEIKNFIEEQMGLENIFKNTRRRDYVDARRILFYILRNKFLLTYQEIGDISNRNHATIIHAQKDFKFLIKSDVVLSSVYEKSLEKSDVILYKPLMTRKEQILKKIEMLNQEFMEIPILLV